MLAWLMDTTLVHANLPPELTARARSYVNEGWAGRFDEVLTDALRRFLVSHASRVTENLGMEDVKWGLSAGQGKPDSHSKSMCHLIRTILTLFILCAGSLPAIDIPKTAFTADRVEEAKAQAAKDGTGIAVFVIAPDGCAPSQALSSSALEKFSPKFTIIVLNCTQWGKGEPWEKLPLVGKEMDRIMKEEKKFGQPALFMMDTKTSKIYGKVDLNRDHLSRSVTEAKNMIASAPENEGEEGEEEKPKFQDWTNSKGRAITAAALRIDDGMVVFLLKSEKEVKYSVKELSEESQKKLKQMFPQS